MSDISVSDILTTARAVEDEAIYKVMVDLPHHEYSPDKEYRRLLLAEKLREIAERRRRAMGYTDEE